jgi:hypothetical protein
VTIDLPIAWTGLVFGVVGFTYALIRDVMDGRRIDQLEKVTAGLRGDITEIIRDHRNNLAQINARIDSLHIPEPREPATLPQPIVRGVPTDTAEGAAVLEREITGLADAMASHGKHAWREGTDA